MDRSTRAHVQAHLEEAAELLSTMPDDERPRPQSKASTGPWAQLARSIISVLVTNWRLLLVGMVVGPLIALVLLMITPPEYVAEALVAPNRTRTDIQFEPSIKTSSVSDSSSSATAPLSPERLQALVDMLKSGELEPLVIQRLQGKVDQSLLQPGKLRDHVRGSLLPKSEMISIRADSTNSTDAVTIANAWAESYVNVVNRVYAGAGATGSLVALEAERDQSAVRKDQAQAALVAGLGDGSLEAEQNQISDLEHQLSQLQSAYQAGAFGGTPGAVDAELARNDYRLAEVRTLNEMARTLRRLDATRQSLQALQDQERAGSPSDTAAVLLLKTQLVALSDGLPSQIQFQLSPNAVDSASDLRQLGARIDEARAALSDELDSRRAAFESKRATETQQLQESLRALRADVEARSADRKDLTLKRDLAWATYSALAKKVEERKVAEGTISREVELAGVATTAYAPAFRIPTYLGIAAAAGVLLAALIALIRTHFPTLVAGGRDFVRESEAAPAA